MNAKIRVGIVGVHPERGWAGIAHIPALRAIPDYEISALSNSDPEQARAAAEKYGVRLGLTATAELVTHPDVDLVVVSVRVPFHLEVVTQAIEAGKMVFSEWPLGASLSETITLADLARRRAVRTAIGLQTRAAPALNYARDLLRQGYVGEVLSSSLIVSGISWGAAMNRNFAYTLDTPGGAGMLHVPVAHTLDVIAYVLGTGFGELDSTLAVRRKSSRMIETGEELPMRTPDQIAVSGSLENGTFVNAHFRGGLSRASNFYWEINGSAGDLVITNPVGYVGIGGFQLRGAQGEGALSDLAVPPDYGAWAATLGMGENVALAYVRLAQDIRTGSTLSPTFDDAVALHRLIDRLEANAPTQEVN